MPGAFHFDPNRCTGCRACELACSIENDLGPDRTWRQVVTFNEDAIPGIQRYHLSLACNHCSEPACMYACPALAYRRDATGAVLLDPGRCIGCRYCSWACPYGAPTYEEERGVMGKCTFCSHRLAMGLKPACATLCPTGALEYADLPATELRAVVAGFPQTDLGPSIRIETPRRAAPEDGSGRAHGRAPGGGRIEPAGIDLKSEWSLAAFTFLVALMFAVFVSLAGGRVSLPAGWFAGGCILAAAFSLSHLGRPARAWRAGLNVRRSWLSREVVAFGAFAAAGTAALWGGMPIGTGVSIVVAGLGLVTLIAADQVYRPVHPGSHPILDAGGSVLTGLYLAGLLLGKPWLAGPVALIKAGALARSARGTASVGRSAPGVLSVGQAGLGLALPLGTWMAAGSPLPLWAILCAVAGEALGRVGFYLRLRILTPALQARADLVEPPADAVVRRAS